MPPLFELWMLVNGKHWNHKRINSISIDSHFLGNHFWQNDGDFLMKSCAKQVDVVEEFAHQLLPRNVHYCVIPTKLDEWCSTAMSIWISRCRVECVHVKTLHRQQSSQCTAWHLFTHLFMAHKTIHRSASKTLKRERKHINIFDAFVFNSFVFVLFFWRKVPPSKWNGKDIWRERRTIKRRKPCEIVASTGAKCAQKWLQTQHTESTAYEPI